DMNRVFYLLENANVDERRFQGDLITLLSKAVERGDQDSVQRLLDYGVDVNAANRDGDTQLSIAVANEDMEMSRLLLEHGANPNEAVLIFDVIKRENMAYLDLLMEYGGDINKENEAGLLPIQQAVSDGDGELVKVLLELGADVLQQGNSGHALQIAVNRRQTTMIEFLLEHVKHDERLTEADLMSIIDGAILSSNHSLIEQVLAIRQLPIPQTKLFAAINKQDLQMVKLFLDAGAVVDGQSMI